MKFSIVLGVLLLTAIIILYYLPSTSYAWLQTYEISEYSPPGFFTGIYHGLIAPFAVIAQLFDNEIILYSSANSGFGYNLGFLLGISAIVGGSKTGYDSTRRSE